jgi:hypothetical protein
VKEFCAAHHEKPSAKAEKPGRLVLQAHNPEGRPRRAMAGVPRITQN